ncbi:phosphatase PAP2 family protein [Faecalibacillus faecis]|uniref:phosphatase PAP2 family protein n=1 Tax=Faecalibacillus faecis TaxID=1982628 RepID=UPI000E51B5CC|nr:phosphatase PAP2 family protein [Faecalibacillus faecis]RGT58683.1 PAP2 family protein [Coprobacillus sp. AF18-40]RGT80742.1 PAP2 family protein [Coprobacillus sp. AF18-15LB]RHB01267.1 PAP2 family protein [Coprobacillus sp. AM42-12AC]RHH11259.1 PAP2 family protein [Coprobacillus sp. AM18-4LB-d2]RHP26198.1 PAP2 family protein [Coprobacillus sp. AF34-1BH]RHQ83055.1 PAP2 family protein [Coprobacillus sp. AF21-8LB]
MKKKFLFMIPLCLFIIDYFLIQYQVIQPIDWFIYHLVQNLKCDFMTSFFKLCSTLGSTWFYVILVLTLVILKNKKDIWVGIHLLIIQGINRIIKALVKRPRPPQIYHLVKETNYSFPSGHSMSAMIGYGLLVLEVQKSALKYKKVIEIFLIMMIFLIGLSRIYLGVHYFSDVIGGFLLSLSYLLFIYYNTSLYT